MVIEARQFVVVVTAIAVSLIGASMIVAPGAWARMRHESPDRVDRPLTRGAHSYRTQLVIGGAVFIGMGVILLYGVLFGEPV